MKKRLLLFISFFYSMFASAQIEVVDNQTAQQLAQTLVGQGVIMLNPTLNCTDIANGKFSLLSGTTNLGIDSGIILTSGRALTLSTFEQGVNGPNNGGAGPATDNGAGGDPDLNTVLNGLLSADACILEFDFVPAGDTVKFDYVFGSSEYQSFSCSGYNDIFGFFISGPGYSTPANIALIPGTDIPICVNSTTGVAPWVETDPNCTSMGPGSPFSEYYVDNINGATITYGGFTTVYTAIAAVVPCDTFHLKLAIADGSPSGGDRTLDSGVFLKAGSLNSVGISLEEQTTYGHNDTIPHCVRGCKSSFITFSRPAPRPTPLTVNFLIEGNAINGTDYEMITDSVVIPANASSIDLEIKPLLAQTATGPRDVIIKVLSPYSCGNGQANILDTAIVRIYDSLYVDILSPTGTTCPNTEIEIVAEIDTTLNFSWSPAALIPGPLPLTTTVHPKPTVPTTYTITVTMPGAPLTCPPAKRSYFADVEPIPELIMPAKDTIICYADSVALNVYALPEGINYNYTWTPASYLRDDFSANNKFFAPPGDYKIAIEVATPVAHCTSQDSMIIRIVPPFEFISVTPSDTTIKLGDSIVLNSESEAIYWLWLPGTYLSDPLAKSPYAFPEEDISYTLIGINEHGCKDTAFINIDVDYEPKIGMPNAFTPNGDGLNDVFKLQNVKFEKLLSFQVFNRYGQLVFETQNPNIGWDGTYKGQPAAADVYFYIIHYSLPGGVQKMFKSDVTLIR